MGDPAPGNCHECRPDCPKHSVYQRLADHYGRDVGTWADDSIREHYLGWADERLIRSPDVPLDGRTGPADPQPLGR